MMKALYSNEASAGESLALRYWCGDESRFGLKTIPRRRINAQGVKPIGPQQWLFHAYYLYGLVEPSTGEHFVWEFSHCDSTCFAVFLQQFAARYPHELHVLQLDQASFHHTRSLTLPDNIILLFQPPKSPELNPIERLWQHLKDRLAWGVFPNLDALRQVLDQRLRELTPAIVASLTGFDFIVKAVQYANFY
jgi:transposase